MKTVKLGDIFNFYNGRAFKKSEWKTSGIPIVRIQNLNKRNDGFNYFQGNYDVRIEINDGDLLFSWSGTVGTSFGPHIWNGGKAVLNQHIFKLVKKVDVDDLYAFYALKEITTEIEKQAHGAGGLVHITKSKLEKFTIPFPSLAEQRRISEKLMRAYERMDMAEVLMRRNLDNVTALQKSILHKYLSADIDTFRLADLLKIRHGKDWKNLASGNIPVYGSGGFMGKYVDAFAYDKPTVLLPRKGTITNVFYLDEPFWNVDTVFYTEIDTDRLLPRYLYHFMQTVDLKSLDSGSGRPSLTQTILYDVEMPVPSIEKQAEVIAKIDDVVMKCDRIKENYTKKLAQLTDLRQSLLQEAFSTTNKV